MCRERIRTFELDTEASEQHQAVQAMNLLQALAYVLVQPLLTGEISLNEAINHRRTVTFIDD